MKSDLQFRAERASERFAKTARKPIVIEFAGVPKAGKTTTIAQLQTFLKRCGFRTEVVAERASVCPIRDKKHSNFNVWTACTTLAQILEKTQDPPRTDDPHILILDRGIFDSICWLEMMEQLARIRHADRMVIERFLRTSDWRERISAVFLMIASPEDALNRELGVLPVEDSPGSIMNVEVLKQIKEVIQKTANRLEEEFRIYQIDTSYGDTKDDPKRTAEKVVDLVLSLVEEQIKEEILFLPKALALDVFGENQFLDSTRTNHLNKLFIESGGFQSREDVEADVELVQAIPIVIVRNSSGEVLRLRRRERSSVNPLNQKIVIWAGGHVRREDTFNGDPILHGALRELAEELRLNVEPETLKLIGSVYFDAGGSTGKHVGIVYEWSADTDDVAIALSSAEFSERRGTSMSGSFVTLEELARDVDEGKITEPWSTKLVREYLVEGGFGINRPLF